MLGFLGIFALIAIIWGREKAQDVWRIFWDIVAILCGIFLATLVWFSFRPIIISAAFVGLILAIVSTVQNANKASK